MSKALFGPKTKHVGKKTLKPDGGSFYGEVGEAVEYRLACITMAKFVNWSGLQQGELIFFSAY
jgi:hypothetical protein